MEIAYTLHSDYMINKRKMSKVWIEEVIRYPDKLKEDNDKYYARKKLNGFTIEVVYEKNKYIKVITAYWI